MGVDTAAITGCWSGLGAGLNTGSRCTDRACFTGIATRATVLGVDRWIDTPTITQEHPCRTLTCSCEADFAGLTGFVTDTTMGWIVGGVGASVLAGCGGKRRAFADTSPRRAAGVLWAGVAA